MKAIEAFFDALMIGLCIVIVGFGALFAINHNVEVKTFPKPTFAGIELPVIVTDSKTHHMYEFNKVILDISYDK